ncbi:MAG: amino acid adenylation [Paraglaciecola sp.]|nr:amino acid adenylation [Paraglaciecola sp.]
MRNLFCATNALTKWLKTDLPRLPAAPGKQVGVNGIFSTSEQMCWQLHIIENSYGSWHKTIIATEANSRFTVFMPVDLLMTPDQLSKRLHMEWQYVLAETLQQHSDMPRSDIALLLSNLSDINFEAEWVKNTDLSVNGHIGDAGLWVTQMLADKRRAELSPELALELAIYLNTQPKRVKNQSKKFIPAQKLFDYCHSIFHEND